MRPLIFGLLIAAFFAINAFGNNPVTGGNFTDTRDGKTYRAIRIGNRTWMAENLNYETKDSWCYGNNNSNCARYGRLYTWDAAMSACPSGWRLATRADWDNLVSIAGGSLVASTRLKSKTCWTALANMNKFPLIDGTDDFGFSAMPGGIRITTDEFHYAGSGGFWWSAALYENDGAVSRSMFWGSEDVAEVGGAKSNGLSVRCVMD